MRKVSRVILLFVASQLAGVIAAPLSALAAGPALEQAAKVLSLNREAMELYEELEFELAKRGLEEAVAIIREARLQDHLVAAKTYGNLGVLYAAGFKDQAQAVGHFQAALAVKSDFEIPKDFHSPEAVSALEMARTGKVAPAEVASDAPVPNRTKGTVEPAALRCPSSGEVFAGDDVTLRCVTQPGFEPASVLLHYKKADSEDFKALPMRAKPARNNKAMWSASIPARDVSGKWVPFYFEAKDAGGETLAQAGRYESPNILAVKAGEADVKASVRAERREAEEESDDDDEVDDGEENPLAKAGKAKGHKRKGKWFVGLGLGSGAGYAAGPGVEAYHDRVTSFTPGLAFAGAGHASPELGYMITATTALTIQTRHQYIPRPDSVTAGGANAAFLRALFFTGTGPSRFYGILAAGGGEGFRLKVEAATNDNRLVQDTVRGGPFVGGAGVGYSHDLGQTLELMLETNVLAGVPDFSMAFDVNAGVRALF